MLNEKDIVFFGKTYVAIWRHSFHPYHVSYGKPGDGYSRAIVEVKFDSGTRMYGASLGKGIGISYDFFGRGESIEVAVEDLEAYLRFLVDKLSIVMKGDKT